MKGMIFPNALVAAARTFARKPAVVGEVLVALVAEEAPDADRTLSDVQRYILAQCRYEISQRAERREAAAERKRRQRAHGGK